MDTQDQFDGLKTRFAPALRFMEEQGASIRMMNVQDGRLIVRAVVESEGLRERIVERFRSINPTLDAVHVDVQVDGSSNVPQSGQSTVHTSQNFSQTGEILPGEPQ